MKLAKLSLNAIIIITISSCSSSIKNDLEFSLGRKVSHHDAFLGIPESTRNENNHKINTYVHKNTGCRYELTLNKNNIVTEYKFISKKSICKVPMRMGP